MKTYRERTNSILQKAKQKERKRKIFKRTGLASLILAVVTVCNLVLFLPYSTNIPSVKKYENSEYYPVISAINTMVAKKNAPKYKNNYEKWKNSLKNLTEDKVGTAIPEYESNFDDKYIETTDNQVDGVIEGDLFKRTNSHIFYLDTQNNRYYNPCVRVFSIERENSREINSFFIIADGESLAVDSQPQLYLSADGSKLTVLSSVVRWSEKTSKKAIRYTVVANYDVSNPYDIEEINKTYLTGDLISSRKIENKLLLFNAFSVGYNCNFEDKTSYLPHYGTLENLQPIASEDIVCPETVTLMRYTVICEINLENFEVSDCAALFSHSNNVYVSQKNIFVTSEYTEIIKAENDNPKSVVKTAISCISFDEDGLNFKDKAIVDGRIKNQYSMDEYENILRVVTTNIENSRQAGSLYCVDLNSFEIVGKVEKFITDESVESVRFDGNKAYVCTAVVITFTDPVFAFDLSDVKNITYVDTGVIQGYSTSLVDFMDGYLLGIGYGSNRNLKIEIYFETAQSVESVCAFEIEESFSEDYKSYYINRELGLIGLCTSNGEETYRLLQFDGYGFQEIVKEVLQYRCNPGNVRATLIENDFYILAGNEENFVVVNLFE